MGAPVQTDMSNPGGVGMPEGAIFFTLVNMCMMPLMGIVLSFPMEKVHALTPFVVARR